MIHGSDSGGDQLLPALRAIVYLRDLVDHARAVAHCAARGHRLVGVVHDPDGARWYEAVNAALTGQCEVIVLLRLGDLPDDRLPRTEIVDVAGVQVETTEDVRPLYRRPQPRD